MNLHLIVALPSEARPLLDRFSLRAAEGHAGLYAGDGVRLLVTGIGKVAAASGVGYLAGAMPEPAIWLNVGIAGHRRRPVGEVLMADSVLDRSSGQTFYPPLVVPPPVETTKIVSVDRPETEYAEDAAFDMEASAFFGAARRFQSAELVHSLKVISDGPDAPIESITRQKVTAWIEEALPAILELHRSLKPLAEELEASNALPPEEDELLERWHFSVSDRRALRRELVRRRVLQAPLPEGLFSNARRGRDVVRALRDYLDRRAVGSSR